MANRLRGQLGGCRFFMRTLLPIVSLAMSSSCAAEKYSPMERCRADFLRANGVWAATSFSRGMRPEILKSTQGNEFTPIQKVVIDHGVIYAQTWGSDALPVSVTVIADKMFMKPRYLDWLGTDDDIGRAAKSVAPYAKPTTVHVLSLEGDCLSPSKIEVIIKTDKEDSKIILEPESGSN